MPSSTTDAMLSAAKALSEGVETLAFSSPTEVVYNPLRYAWEAHALYIKKHAQNKKKVIFLGMNPGPYGMAQCGVPFGEIELVRDWVGVEAPIAHPEEEHPKRPIEGFACTRSEVSGRRLWGAFKERFGTAEAFFKDHFVANCLSSFISGNRSLSLRSHNTFLLTRTTKRPLTSEGRNAIPPRSDSNVVSNS